MSIDTDRDPDYHHNRFMFALDEALRAVGAHGRFGHRKVWLAAVHRALLIDLSIAAFREQLLAAHRRGAVELARADLVAAMDPRLVADSEIAADGASWHFVVDARAAELW